MDWSSSQVGHKTNSRLADDQGAIRGLEFEDAGCGRFYGVRISKSPFRLTTCNPRGMLLIGHSPEMNESGHTTSGSWWRTWLLDRVAELRQREEQVFLVLALVIGALTGLAVVAFILLTERMGMRLYPVGGAPWRRLLFPVAGSLGIGYLLHRYFPDARGSGVPQTKAALFAREGRITLRTVLGKFLCMCNKPA